MEIKKHKPSKRPPKTGDLFLLETSNNENYYGRVVKDNAIVGPFKNAWLIYIYKKFKNNEKTPNQIENSHLLVPPLLVNQSPWKKGYFHFIENIPLSDNDILPFHLFKNKLNHSIFDEFGNEIESHQIPNIEKDFIGDHSLKFDNAAIKYILNGITNP